ncbi:uncharacterized protein B0I36DRAFT_132764 [Microdochium trichocladiopsis]|uniref:Uncharacterized protein n=1 Tax=Microdochium trichocladiopsis TaxID=1682393 RepID=A0A9P9BPT0_9PEZI|nr:uncharacterized protein B0I36DRAFT_132764 [Microdochium trichocladiopsis]KAH7029440.1 hypothetical protein B0I36DRAFT_132764 [Microdochium trichocladiopsis]
MNLPYSSLIMYHQLTLDMHHHYYHNPRVVCEGSRLLPHRREPDTPQNQRHKAPKLAYTHIYTHTHTLSLSSFYYYYYLTHRCKNPSSQLTSSDLQEHTAAMQLPVVWLQQRSLSPYHKCREHEMHSALHANRPAMQRDTPAPHPRLVPCTQLLCHGTRMEFTTPLT